MKLSFCGSMTEPDSALDSLVAATNEELSKQQSSTPPDGKTNPLADFCDDAVKAIGNFGVIVVYLHRNVLRFGPPDSAAAKRAIAEDDFVGLYDSGTTAEQIYIDCSYFMSERGHGMC